MSMKIAVIAAACRNNGIGVNGRLPWRLKSEMAFFTRITSATDDQGGMNAVIMGRRTWDCIPAKFRPLANRYNVVLSKSLDAPPEGADFLFRSLDDAILELRKNADVGKLFVIGGARVYKDAMDLEQCERIYLTRVDADFDCDTFFPDFDTTKYVESSDDSVPSDEQEENGIKYRFCVYDRVKSTKSA